MTKVALLGAGFSRAVHPAMPTMAELGPEVVRLVDASADTLERFGNDVEAWLSHLASDPPWETEAANLRHRAMFREAVDAVYTVMTARQEVAEQAGLAPWLRRLSWDWSYRSAQVLTFNYDTLVERALAEVGAHGALADLYAMPLTETFAAGSGGRISAGPPSGPLPTLYKLHGSTNWLHGGSRAPVTERPILREPDPDQRSPREDRVYDGLIPLIVPPASSKSQYYDNVALRAQWQRAGDALKTATQLDVIGYSLPVTDLSTRTFLSTLLPEDCPISVVNPDQRAVEAVAQVVGNEGRITHFASTDKFVEEKCGDVVEWWYTNDSRGSLAHFEINGVEEVETITDPLTPEQWIEARRRERWRGMHPLERSVSRPDGTMSRIGYVVARNEVWGV